MSVILATGKCVERAPAVFVAPGAVVAELQKIGCEPTAFGLIGLTRIASGVDAAQSKI
jgi:hypothetical protein